MYKLTQTATALLAALVLVNCGGGGGSDSSSTTPPAPVVVVEDTPGETQTDQFSLAIDNIRVESERDNRLTVNLANAVTALPEIELWLNDSDGNALTGHDIAFTAELSDGGQSLLIAYRIGDNTETLDRAVPVQLAVKVAGEQTHLDIALYDVPPMSALTWPQRTFFSHADHLDPLLESDSIVFQWLNLDPWPIPDDPTWEEDPYESISWRLFYHSMGWVTGFGRRYIETGDTAYLERVDFLLNDYEQTFSDTESDDLAYREDAVSLRLNHLMYLYLNIYREMPVERRTVIESLIAKATGKLRGYLNETFYDGNNHGLIQSRSALNVVMAMPHLAAMDSLAEDALARTRRAAEAMFSSAGALALEQAPGYHYAAVAMLLESQQMIELASLPMPQGVDETVRDALIMGVYLLNEDGTLPAIGDTQYAEKFDYVMGLLYRAYGKSIPVVDAYYEHGVDALDDMKVDSDEGLVIVKQRHGSGGLSKWFFDAGPARYVHGHFDNLNLVGRMDGEPLLVDSGGPYGYGTPHRGHFMQVPAHNTVQINDVVRSEYSATLLTPVETDHSFIGAGSQPSDEDSLHRRAFAVGKGDIPYLLVVDEVTQPTNEVNNVRAFWHYPPEAEVALLGDGLSRITLVSGKQYHHHHNALSNEECLVVEGELDRDGSYWLGWVTTGINIAVPAPMTICFVNTAEYRKVNLFTSAPNLAFNVTDLGSRLSIKVGERHYVYDKATHTLSD